MVNTLSFVTFLLESSKLSTYITQHSTCGQSKCAFTLKSILKGLTASCWDKILNSPSCSQPKVNHNPHKIESLSYPLPLFSEFFLYGILSAHRCRCIRILWQRGEFPFERVFLELNCFGVHFSCGELLARQIPRLQKAREIVSRKKYVANDDSEQAASSMFLTLHSRLCSPLVYRCITVEAAHRNL